MSWDNGRWVPAQGKEWAAVKLDDGTWAVRSFGSGSPVGADVMPTVWADCDDEETNAKMAAALPQLSDLAIRIATADPWTFTPKAMAELIKDAQRVVEIMKKGTVDR